MNDSISIPDRSRPGTTRSFPVGHQSGNDKCATGAKLRAREDITTATWNVRTLRAAGKVEELLHELADTSGASLDCVRWDGKSLEKSQQMGSHSVFQWKRGQTWTRSGFASAQGYCEKYHRLSPSFKQNHDNAAESNPFQHYHHSGVCTNIKIWWQRSWWVLQFYKELQSLVDQTPKQDILVVQGDWNAKVGEDAQGDCVDLPAILRPMTGASWPRCELTSRLFNNTNYRQLAPKTTRPKTTRLILNSP